MAGPRRTTGTPRGSSPCLRTRSSAGSSAMSSGRARRSGRRTSTTIRGWRRRARRRHPDFEEYPEYLRRALGEAQRASGIVDRLLEYVREKSPTLESVDMRQILAEAVDLVAGGARARGQAIHVTAGDTPLRVQADPVMLCQVLLNIVANALDALDGPGRVDVDLRRDEDGFPGNRVVVRVRDPG